MHVVGRVLGSHSNACVFHHQKEGKVDKCFLFCSLFPAYLSLPGSDYHLYAHEVLALILGANLDLESTVSSY